MDVHCTQRDKINTTKRTIQEARKTANPKETRCKELKPKLKLIDTETTAKGIINKTKSFFFEKIIKLDKLVVGWIKQKIKHEQGRGHNFKFRRDSIINKTIPFITIPVRLNIYIK